MAYNTQAKFAGSTITIVLTIKHFIFMLQADKQGFVNGNCCASLLIKKGNSERRRLNFNTLDAACSPVAFDIA